MHKQDEQHIRTFAANPTSGRAYAEILESLKIPYFDINPESIWHLTAKQRQYLAADLDRLLSGESIHDA